ncbi:MAG: prepilin-type N-terminal cleavage/methylation domain-containing protein [bacterium]|nr:prepilin-type N-terminal cleavage/methylation domain-containing protein [bacterium]
MSLNKGMTLVEILLVLSILVVLLIVVLPNFARFRSSQVLSATVSDILSSLDKARSQSLNSLDSSEYGVHFDSNQIVIFKGIVYSALTATNEIIPISSPASLSTITLASGGSDVYFARLSGAPSTTGTVVVTVSSLTKTITIGATGIFSSN